MTNQAAQTMPELPRPEWTARKSQTGEYAELVPEGWEDEMWAYGTVRAYTADQVRQYARDYAAALSQPAGVPREPTREHIQAFKRAEIKCVADYDDHMSPEYRGLEAVFAMLAATPAASGVHPDALPDGTLSKSTAKRVEALAAASVSERARAILSQAYRDAGFDKAAEWVLQVDLDNELYVLDRAVIRAIEQALTQQRGEVVGEPGARIEVLRRICKRGRDYFYERKDSRGIDLFEHMETEVGWLASSLATTPQPSADALRELVKRWRECAKSAANGPMFDGASEYAVAGTYIDCADELGSLLSGGSHA